MTICNGSKYREIDIDLMRTPEQFADEIKQLRSEVDLLKRDLWTAYLEVKRLGYRLMKYEPVEDPMPGVADDTQTR